MEKRRISWESKELEKELLETVKDSYKIKRHQFTLTENNRLTYVYKISKTGKIVEVVCVSLEIKMKKKWETILYYDNHHEKMHAHFRVSIDNDADTPTLVGVRQKGTTRRLLKWAIKDITLNYVRYKTNFLRRCGYTDELIWINLP